MHSKIRVVAATIAYSIWSTAGSAQSVEGPNVNPAAINAGTATQVSVSVLIFPGSHTILTNSVNLLQVDENGNNAIILDPLNDAGVNGDAIANDGVYSGTVILSPGASGRIYLRVAVAFSGLIRRLLSVPVPIQVMPPGLPTHPKPMNPNLTAIDTVTGNTVICNELLVTLQSGVTSDAAASLIASHGASLIGVLAALGVYQVGLSTCDSSSLAQARSRFIADPLVGSVDFDGVSSLSQVSRSPNDPFFLEGAQWGLQKVNIPLGWSVAQSVGVQRSARIGVVDSGVNANHEDLFAHVISGYNWCPSLDHNQCTGNTSNTADDYGHGTAVTGLAAAVTNNATGVASPAYNALIVAEKVNAPGTPELSAASVANGIYDAVYQGARVVNVSAGSSAYCSQTLLNAVQYAAQRDVTIVASAGNFGDDTRICPAAYSDTNANVIAVAASDQNDQRSMWKKADGSICNAAEPSSNYGSWVTVYAPGSEVFLLQYDHNSGPLAYEYGFGTDMGLERTCSGGTSYAAPLVTGTIALMLSVNNSLSPTNVRALLSCSADQIGVDPDGNTMYRLNAGTAIQYASEGTSCNMRKTVTVQFGGTVTFITDQSHVLPPGLLAIGETVSGSFTYDPTVPNVSNNPGIGWYDQLGVNTTMTVTISGSSGSITFTSSVPPSNYAVITSLFGESSGLEVDSFVVGPSMFPTPAGNIEVSLNFENQSGQPPFLSSIALPKNWNIISLGSDQQPGLGDSQITSFSVISGSWNVIFHIGVVTQVQ